MSKTDQIQDLVERNVVDIIIREELEQKLKTAEPLRIKFGIDPTGDKIHIGHAVVYWKLRAFQELGHKVIILIGDYTALVGDASDKTAERQMMSVETVKSNMKKYLEQIGQIVDLGRAEVRYNSEWLGKLSFLDVLELASEFKVAQMLERDNFRERYQAGKPVGLQEFLYPVMQGYDSVALEADVELGGTEQLFNLMAGRVLQRRKGQAQQNVMTLELLTGNDGRKMSKSLDNCIYVTDKPADMYGKVMTIRDELIPSYFRMCTDTPLDVVTEVEQNMAGGDNPRDTKASLARAIVGRYYGAKAAEEAEAAWNLQFREGNKPTEMIEHKSSKGASLVDVAAEVFELSKSEVRRVIEQGGVQYSDVPVENHEATIEHTGILQLGKRRYAKIIITT